QKLFGDFLNGYTELAIPAADLGLLRYLRQTLVQAWRQTLLPVAGPVHLNCPFRDPLFPLEDGSTTAVKELASELFFAGVQVFSSTKVGQSLVPGGPSRAEIGNTTPLPFHFPLPSTPSSQGLIIAGPAQPLDAEAYCDAIANLSRHLQWPVLAEGLSPLRNHAAFNPHLITTYDAILRQPDLAAQLVPDQVIQIGPLPTSKTLRQWLERVDPLRWVVDDGYRNLDPLHGKTVPLASLVELPESIEAAIDGNYLKTWLELDFKVRQRLDQTFEKTTDLVESKVAWLLSRTLPAETPLVIANSMPVRDIEWFWSLNDRGIRPYFNRGANGIDGTLSMALGIAHGNQPTVLLTGDLALLHDTNGFLSSSRLRGHLTIVLINNSGGGIFEMLPISKFDPPFEDFFATPQTVDVAKLCAAYSADYERVDDWQTISQRLGSLPQVGVRVLEVRCDRKTDAPFRQTLLNTLAKFP
ncbi:MAG: 2-succinyl-5-enolpyruvyl-6-hydroxy-3-cyclohexene-1-carboxylic-acid synthase, partial [Cyanobacteria bacterium Co-bin8]|nr:2-succinyl-5-enolpyruvyl-6-hydroxy-3-cyclohexene-1-carboxylic-acid synthase [Cyanobacteria bacterium Co-bin8]